MASVKKTNGNANMFENFIRETKRFLVQRSGKPFEPATRPLVVRLSRYDRARKRVFKNFTRSGDYQRINSILQDSFLIAGVHTPLHYVQLSQPEKLKNALKEVNPNLHLQIRTRFGWPVYLYSRITYRPDVYGVGYIKEKLYQSPDFPGVDERMLKLGIEDRDRLFLDYSPYRRKIRKELVKKRVVHESREIDRIQAKIHPILSRVWNPEQPELVVADCLEMPNFRHCRELLNLVLNYELCELRMALDKETMGFFQKIYPNPMISQFLTWLTRLSRGNEVIQLNRQAGYLALQLSNIFQTFFKKDVTWGVYHQQHMRIGWVLLGNWTRLATVSKKLKNDPGFIQSRDVLENDAKAIFQQLINFQK